MNVIPWIIIVGFMAIGFVVWLLGRATNNVAAAALELQKRVDQRVRDASARANAKATAEAEKIREAPLAQKVDRLRALRDVGRGLRDKKP